MEHSWVRLRTAVLLISIGFSVAGCGYEDIPTKEESAKAAWSEVQNQCGRRSDLVPELVKTVQGYASQEQDLLAAVTEARAKAIAIPVGITGSENPEQLKQFTDAQNDLSGALGRLLALGETDPDLKSNQTFLALQSQIGDIDRRIAVARHDYVSRVHDYNLSLHTFPDVIWQTLVFHRRPMASFTAGDGADKAPELKL